MCLIQNRRSLQGQLQKPKNMADIGLLSTVMWTLMCGRFTLAERLERLRERFGIIEVSFDYEPSYNIAPSQTITAVVHTSRGNIMIPVRWGFQLGDILAINARDDKIIDVTTFRRAFEQSRCLIPASGFYEWQSVGRKKIPKYIRMKSQEPFAFAGLLQEWRTKEGTLDRRTTIITTSPNEVVAPIHDRMPVILPPEEENNWLNPSTDLDLLATYLVPYQASEMDAYTVSARVNSVSNNDPSLTKPKKGLESFL